VKARAHWWHSCVYKAWPHTHCFTPPLHCTKALTSPRLAKSLTSASPLLAIKAMPTKSYSRKGHLALLPFPSIVIALPTTEEAGPMVRPSSVSAEVELTSSCGRYVSPSCSRTPSPRLPLLSPLLLMTTLMALAAVVRSPPPLPVWSTSPLS
jgi:hypothetical protein